jgi:single-stranded-DNA-specific exonuclease
MQFPAQAGQDAVDLARTLGVTRTAAAVLVSRGMLDASESSRFLDPRLAHLTPPDAMKDRGEAVERLARAARAGERVCVFGDYDADGVTAAALITDVLRALGAEVVPVLADRFDGGYGLSAPALVRILATGATLLVTCDCGSSDHERLEAVRRAGVDAVVIDHHRVPDDPLPALAFLNPHRPECGFPYKGLASVGLALSVGAGVRAELGVALDMRRWLDLVAIGTIGDVAPLDGDNRALVRAGLALLAKGARPGTRALAEIARCGSGPPTGEDVSFRLAPRINAPGRLDKPDLSLALLLATTDVEARRIAAEVEVLCTRRKEVERAVTAEALAMLEDAALASLPAIVLGRQGWHPGVVGIVAGRLASRFGKPTIILALDGARGRGSVRGPAGFSVYDALVRVRDVLFAFGGHHAAAGVEMASDRLETLRERFGRVRRGGHPQRGAALQRRCGSASRRGGVARHGGSRTVRTLRSSEPGAAHRDRAGAPPRQARAPRGASAPLARRGRVAHLVLRRRDGPPRGPARVSRARCRCAAPRHVERRRGRRNAPGRGGTRLGPMLLT